MQTEDEFLHDLVEKLGQQAFLEAIPQIDSQTLRQSMELIVQRGTTGEGWRANLYIPQYWAVYYHDGRGGFGPQTKAFLVYFRNPSDDPRLSNGYPTRASQIRQLTAEEFRDGLHQNSLNNKAGKEPFMYVVRSVGPAGAHPFFEEGMVHFGDTASLLITGEFDAYIQQLVDEEGIAKLTAKFNLGG